jgi:hypothetical protein
MGSLVLEDKVEYELIKLDTERGEVRCRYYFPYSQHPASVAVVYVTGVGGDWEHLQLDWIQDSVVLSQERELMDYVFAIDTLPIYQNLFLTRLQELLFLKISTEKKLLDLWAIPLVVLKNFKLCSNRRRKAAVILFHVC